METATERITARRFMELEDRGEFRDRFVQLVDGELIVTEPLPLHGVLQIRLGTELQNWARGGSGRGLVCSPTDVVMDDYNVYGPDLLWIAEPPKDLRKRLSRVPELCVEIRSPSTWRFDIGAKKRVYEAGALPELWLVDDLAEQIFVFRRSTPRADHFDVALELDRGDILASPLLPGFALSLDELFTV